jgi:hypothetical protein
VAHLGLGWLELIKSRWGAVRLEALPVEGGMGADTYRGWRTVAELSADPQNSSPRINESGFWDAAHVLGLDSSHKNATDLGAINYQVVRLPIRDGLRVTKSDLFRPTGNIGSDCRTPQISYKRAEYSYITPDCLIP